MIQVHIEIQGADFHAVECLTVLREEYDLHPTGFGVRGEIGRTGRYRDKPVPYGWASFMLDLRNLTGDGIKYISYLEEESRLHGATSIVLHIDMEHDGQRQCNFELSPVVLEVLSRRGIPLTFSCWCDHDV